MKIRLFGALAVLVVLLFQADPAAAHARYESSTPNDGETVSSPPSQVQADFSEPVTSSSYLRVTDPCGEVVSGASSPMADKVSVSMNGTRAGTYSVYFRVQSSIDSHTTDGTFSFTSSGGDPCPGQEPSGGGGGGEGSSGSGGGGGDDPQPAGGGGGGGSDDAVSSDDGSAGSGVSSADPAEQRSKEGPGGHDGSRKGKGGGGKGKNAGKRSGSNEVALAVGEGERERQGPSPWDLPRDGLIAGLVIAALIGAVGGRIYASIIGPRT